MAKIERTYNVPLRKGTQKAPKYRRAKKAIRVLKEFLKKHMKSDDVLIGRNLNLKIWEKGMKNPPHHVEVAVVKEDDGKVKAELVGFKFEEEKKEKKADTGAKTPIQEKLEELKKKTEKAEKKKEEKPEEKKAPEKVEAKPKAEEKKPAPKKEAPKKAEEKKPAAKKEEPKKEAKPAKK